MSLVLFITSKTFNLSLCGNHTVMVVPRGYISDTQVERLRDCHGLAMASVPTPTPELQLVLDCAGVLEPKAHFHPLRPWGCGGCGSLPGQVGSPARHRLELHLHVDGAGVPPAHVEEPYVVHRGRVGLLVAVVTPAVD